MFVKTSSVWEFFHVLSFFIWKLLPKFLHKLSLLEKFLGQSLKCFTFIRETFVSLLLVTFVLAYFNWFDQISRVVSKDLFYFFLRALNVCWGRRESFSQTGYWWNSIWIWDCSLKPLKAVNGSSSLWYDQVSFFLSNKTLKAEHVSKNQSSFLPPRLCLLEEFIEAKNSIWWVLNSTLYSSNYFRMTCTLWIGFTLCIRLHYSLYFYYLKRSKKVRNLRAKVNCKFTQSTK